MSILSANQLYNLSGASKNGVAFKDWVNSEKAMYQSKIDNGKITGKMPFNDWLHKRWTVKATMSAEGEGSSKILDALKNVGAQVLQKTTSGKSAAAPVTDNGGVAPGTPLQEKRILGMKPGVAYAVGGVLLLSVTVATILIIRKAKKAA